MRGHAQRELCRSRPVFCRPVAIANAPDYVVRAAPRWRAAPYDEAQSDNGGTGGTIAAMGCARVRGQALCSQWRRGEQLYVVHPRSRHRRGRLDRQPDRIPFSGLAFDRSTGILYGSTGNNSGRSLIRIDPTTGAGTLVVPFNTNTPMADLTFGPSGVLFGWSGFIRTRGLYTIDVATGAATFVGPNARRGSFLDGNGLASDGAGNLCGGATNDVADVAALFSVDPATAVSTFIANLTPLPGNSDASVSALAFDSAGTLFGSLAELQQLSKSVRVVPGQHRHRDGCRDQPRPEHRSTRRDCVPAGRATQPAVVKVGPRHPHGDVGLGWDVARQQQVFARSHQRRLS